MKNKTASAIRIYFPPGEESTADLIGGTCDKATQLARDTWGLEPPQDCRIHVMTSWLEFVFRSAPGPWRIVLAATIPFWFLRARRMWLYAGAWTQSFGKWVAIGVKPPRLILQSDRSIGARVFAEEEDVTAKVRQITCHELVHACSAGRKLPMWLNEGIAMVAVDRYAGRQTVRRESLALLRDYLPKEAPPTYQQLSRMGGEAIAYQTARGYWLVRYLEEKLPGFLKRSFSAHTDARTLERDMITGLGMTPESYWREIDGVLAGHFEEPGIRTRLRVSKNPV
jgi:hypothetical protein